MRQLKLLLIGAGERGAHCYAPYALKYPREVAFVGVAEPDALRRDAFGDVHGIPDSNRFAGWEAVLGAGIQADGVIVATQDRQALRAGAGRAAGNHGAGKGIMQEEPGEKQQLVAFTSRKRRKRKYL